MKELAEEIASVVGFNGELIYDTEKPDGAPRRLVDSTRIHELGWQHKVALREGLERSYQYFLNHCADK